MQPLAAKKARNCNGNLHGWGNGGRGGASVDLAGPVDDLDGAAWAVPFDACQSPDYPAGPVRCEATIWEPAERRGIGLATARYKWFEFGIPAESKMKIAGGLKGESHDRAEVVADGRGVRHVWDSRGCGCVRRLSGHAVP